jgi:2-polyprenyl-6-methoxyphenol hydroxylase-like FAD-dependent oxidoreductase
MINKTVLISGAGIAGSTLAYWLARRGFTPTVVEHSRSVRSSGNPVDVRGEAVDVAEQMGVLAELHESATQVTGLRFVNRTGAQVAHLDLKPAIRASGAREVEVPRADLARVLLEVGRNEAEFIFDESITSLVQDDDGVDVRLSSGAERRFDLVIGADGLHSGVRNLAFGAAHEAVHYQGLFVGTLPLGPDSVVADRHEVEMYNEPGISASIHPGAGKPIAAFIFRSPERPDFDHRDTVQHKAILSEHYSEAGWQVPALLKLAQAADEFYFDAVSQVRLKSWSLGRVALLGDAASSVSLFGEGSSLAIIGAATLAETLASHSDHTSAFDSYERTHRALVEPKQRGVRQAARLLVPSSRVGIASRNAAVRIVATASRASRLLRPGSRASSTPVGHRS